MNKPIPFGKYYLLERINVGGMAEVFKAKAFGVEGFERLIAVKRILANIAEDEEFITMFIDEAKIAGQLQHANIAQIFDLGKVEDAYFIAMEYISGKDLRAIFDHLRKLDLTMPIPQLCYAIMQVCEGLDFAHNKKDTQGRSLNLVHRDVSPQNVLIGFEGEVKLVDFGIAKAAGKASKTQAGILKGKFGYMSPEQVRGLPVDRRSDIFSVGICMYELLTGERLFTGESDFSTLEKVRNVEILPPTSFNKQVSPELERIVLKALAKDADDRYQNAIDLHDDLQAFLYGSGELCSRKDLAAWMKRTFAAEIEEENAKLEQYAQLSEPTPGPGDVLDADAVGAEAEDRLGWDDEELETQIFDKVPGEEELNSQDLWVGDDSSAGKPTPAVTARGLGGARAAVASSNDYGGFDADDKTVAQAPSDDLLADMGTAAAQSATRAVSGVPARPSEPMPPSSSGSGLGPPGGLSEVRARLPSSSNGASRPVAAPALRPAGTGGSGLMGTTLPGVGAATTSLRPRGASPLPGPGAFAAPPPGLPAPVPAPPAVTSRLGTLAQAQQRPGARLLTYGVLAVVVVGIAWLVIGRVTKQATISVNIKPGEAKVLLDGEPVAHGESGVVTLKRKPGTKATLRVESPGYLAFQRAVEFKGDVEQVMEVVLRATAQTGFVVKSDPTGVPVWLDGKPLTDTGDETGTQVRTDFKADAMTPGRHVIELRPGDPYEDWSYEFVQEPDKIIQIEAKLRRKDGATAGEAPPVSPRPSTTPAPRPVPEPAPRPAPVARPAPAPVARPAPAPVARPAPAPKPEPVAAAEPGGACTITVGSKPWAQVSVDGKDTGKITPLVGYEVPCGKRKLRFVNPELKLDRTFTVTVKSGEKFKQVFELVEE